MPKKEENVHAGHRQRVRQRVDNDPEFDGFRPHEVLEFLLFHGIPYRDTNKIAHNLINAFGSFDKVFHATPEELMSVKGMTVSAAYTIASVVPIARLVGIHASRTGKVVINSSQDFYDLMKPYFVNRTSEYIYAAFLDAGGRVIELRMISGGEASYAFMDIQKIVFVAKRLGATRVVIAHNHPGGNCFPSFEDFRATEHLALTLAALGISLAEHLIFTETEYFSFFTSGALQQLGKEIEVKLSGHTSQDASFGNIDADVTTRLQANENLLRSIYQRLFLEITQVDEQQD